MNQIPADEQGLLYDGPSTSKRSLTNQLVDYVKKGTCFVPCSLRPASKLKAPEQASKRGKRSSTVFFLFIDIIIQVPSVLLIRSLLMIR
jgi:hypothetical protein